MTITELIGELKMILEEFGDIEVTIPQGDDIAETEDFGESWDADISVVEVIDSESGKIVTIY